LRSTLVLSLPLVEVSAKVRTGPPVDDPEDLDFPVWAGVLPLRTIPDAPIPDALLGDVAASSVVTAWTRAAHE
jgi:hypothetical protein